MKVEVLAMSVSLYDHQLKAVSRLKNGSILVGGVGSGKSRTALGYFFKLHGGQFEPNYKDMKEPVTDLYIITTARKRDTMEWEQELAVYLMSTDSNVSKYKNKIVVDSWNNIKKYDKVVNAFFIFDEQRVVGTGTWAKSFIKIAKRNRWILLSATPGDTWTDYAPVFIANGFYKNFTEFRTRHIVWSRYAKFPKVDHYVECRVLEQHRKDILVYMEFERLTEQHHELIKVDYDKDKYRFVKKKRWNIFTDEPCQDAASYCSVLQKIVNMDPSRKREIKKIIDKHKKIIVFYNYDYELEILREAFENFGIVYSEWNGHKHEELPKGDKWAYLVQYTAGAEGWNCIETNCIAFYSDTYSYKASVQAAGRIDRMNTPFTNLYYYFLVSSSPIDLGIRRALSQKKKFNEKSFIKEG
jgi:hypothetical protein